jgi:hypothetical protein
MQVAGAGAVGARCSKQRRGWELTRRGNQHVGVVHLRKLLLRVAVPLQRLAGAPALARCLKHPHVLVALEEGNCHRHLPPGRQTVRLGAGGGGGRGKHGTGGRVGEAQGSRCKFRCWPLPLGACRSCTRPCLVPRQPPSAPLPRTRGYTGAAHPPRWC